MANRYYPPGLGREDPLVVLYDLVYQLADTVGTSSSSGNNAFPSTVTGSSSGGGGGLVSGASVASGPFETRPSNAVDGSVYVETSRSGLNSTSPFPLFSRNSGAWRFASGMFYRNNTDLATLTATLGVNDSGAVVSLDPPFSQNLTWNGAAWEWLIPSTTEGPFENRPANAANGSIYVETSRSSILSESPAPVYSWNYGWKFVSGSFYRNQTDLATLTATLGANDVGAVVYVKSPYCHELSWNGTGWNWANPADASGRYAFWPTTPSDGWHLADGSVVQILLSDGSLSGNLTLVDAANNALYLKTGAFTGNINNATAPTVSNNSAGTPAGNIAWPANNATFTGSAMGTHAHELPFAIDTGETPPDIDVIDQSVFGTGTNRTTAYHVGGTASVENLAVAKSQAVSAGTPSGNVDWPANNATFTGAAMGNHNHALSMAGGDPIVHLSSPLYYRL